jgi:HEAT repeat protein
VALGRIGGTRALDALLRYATAGERPVSVFRGLQEFASLHPLAPDRAREVSQAVLDAVARHAGTRERQCAVNVLGALGPALLPALKVVIERHAEPHDPLAEVAVLGLGAIGGSEALGVLTDLSLDDRPPLRLLAVQALAGMATPDARQALEAVDRRPHDTAVGLVVGEALKTARQAPSSAS